MNGNFTTQIIFLHIPKTAGSTLKGVLRRLYPPKAVFYRPPYEQREALDELATMDSAEKEKFQLIYIQHAPYGAHECLSGESAYITFLRHPWRRFISDYYHAKTDRDHSFFEKGRAGAGLYDFVIHREEQGLTNPMTRMVSGMHAYSPFGPLPPKALEVAKHNLGEHFVVAGTVAHFDASLLLMKHRLGWGWVFYYRRNVGRKKPDRIIGEERAKQRFMETNALDDELYTFVEERLKAQIQAAGESFARDLRRFQRWNRWYQRGYELARQAKHAVQGLGEVL